MVSCSVHPVKLCDGWPCALIAWQLQRACGFAWGKQVRPPSSK
jgi:hypothetical protein